MNRIHRDGRALLTLSGKTKEIHKDDKTQNATEPQKTNSKPAPPSNIQRQDTDYDVKPSIKKPRAGGRISSAHPRRAQVHQVFLALTPDTGITVHATQMGESEGQVNHDALRHRARVLKALCS